MYNQTYINDFHEDMYLEYLSSPSKLNKISKNYLLQFSKFTEEREEFGKINSQIKKRNNEIRDEQKKPLEVRDNKKIQDWYREVVSLTKRLNSFKNRNCCDNAWDLAFKESLDHYILKCLLEDKDNSLINSKEFQNYLNYIAGIIVNRQFKNGNNTHYLEFNTNVVFRNEKTRNLIFKKLSPKEIEDNNFIIENNKRIIQSIVDRIKNKINVSQRELDFLGEYIYTSRDLSGDKAETFVEYIFNEVSNNPSIKPSIQIMGAITSYFCQFYTKDKRVKNSRMFISDFDKNDPVSIAHSSGTCKYCVFEKDHVLNTSLLSKKSLLKSRTFKENDLYHIMMVAFHELTHEYQKYRAMDEIYTSGGISYIIKNILRVELSKKNKQGQIIDNEYGINHDSTEFEIEADEESWRQCRLFILKHCRDYAYKNGTDRTFKPEFICKKNEEEIGLRRAFSLKKDKNNNLMLYSEYDIRNMMTILKNNPKYLEQFPMLKKFFANTGYLNENAIFTNITDLSDELGLELDKTGIQIATYIVDYGSNHIKDIIARGKLNKEQINNLMLNTYNVIHYNVEKVRGLNKVNLSNYDETDHKYYNLEENNSNIYNHYFMKCANQIYYTVMYMYQIKKNYPEIDSLKYFNDFHRYYKENFIELFNNTKNISSELIESIYQKYESSNTEELMELSQFLKNNYLNRNTTNKYSS